MDILYGELHRKDIEVVILKVHAGLYFRQIENTIESRLLHTEGFVRKAASISDANAEIDEKAVAESSFSGTSRGTRFSARMILNTKRYTLHERT